MRLLYSDHCNRGDFRKLSEQLVGKFQYFLEDPDVVEQVSSIRNAFGLPQYGIGPTPTPAENLLQSTLLIGEETQNKTIKATEPRAKALSKPIKFVVNEGDRSKENQFEKFDKAIRELMGNDIPDRFILAFKIYVIKGVFDLESCMSNIMPYKIHIYEDNGQTGVFVELFGDITLSGVEEAFKRIENNPGRYKPHLRGESLANADTYFRHRTFAEGREPVDHIFGKSLMRNGIGNAVAELKKMKMDNAKIGILFKNLEKKGYVDGKGILKGCFHDLLGPEDLELNPLLFTDDEEQEIFRILKNLWTVKDAKKAHAKQRFLKGTISQDDVRDAGLDWVRSMDDPHRPGNKVDVGICQRMIENGWAYKKNWPPLTNDQTLKIYLSIKTRKELKKELCGKKKVSDRNPKNMKDVFGKDLPKLLPLLQYSLPD